MSLYKYYLEKKISTCMAEYEKDKQPINIQKTIEINKARNQWTKKGKDLFGNWLLFLSEESAICLKQKTLFINFCFSLTAWIGYIFGLSEHQGIICRYEQKIYQLEIKVKNISVLQKEIKLQEQKIFELSENNRKLIELLLDNKKH